MPKKSILTEYEGEKILVENTWLNGISLFHEGTLVAKSNDYISVNKNKPLIRSEILINGTSRIVEVFVVAWLYVKIQIRIDGQYIAGHKLCNQWGQYLLILIFQIAGKESQVFDL